MRGLYLTQRHIKINISHVKIHQTCSVFSYLRKWYTRNQEALLPCFLLSLLHIQRLLNLSSLSFNFLPPSLLFFTIWALNLLVLLAQDINICSFFSNFLAYLIPKSQFNCPSFESVSCSVVSDSLKPHGL